MAASSQNLEEIVEFDEDDRLFWWAHTSFRDMGFEELEAFVLAMKGVSPSELRELEAHGCERPVALRILLPD